jgi:tetratricopeptide (TPR) repeat protein
MKSEHRHELKTNELAEWLGNLPQWTKENLKTIIFAVVLIAVVATLYIWKVYSKNVVQVRERIEFTNLLNEVAGGKMQVLQQQQAQGSDFSYMLIPLARKLESFAQRTKDDRMAALALIKEAETQRAELHYRLGTVSMQDLTEQINLAKASYTRALERCPTNPSLAAAATYGLGLCAEELGNFEQAQQIYNEIVANPDFEGTTASVQAKHRLETMSDYKQEVAFKPAPVPPAPELLPGQPGIDLSKLPFEIKPADTNVPVDFNWPVDINLDYQAPNSVPEFFDSNLPSQTPNAVPDVPDVNLDVGAVRELLDNSILKVVDANVPGE